MEENGNGKICPILLSGGMANPHGSDYRECRKEECQWWMKGDGELEGGENCAVVFLAAIPAGLFNAASELFKKES